MKLGVIFPQAEMTADATTVRRFVTEVAALGADHLLFFEHVVGVDPSVPRANDALVGPTGATLPYDITHEFHEPMVLFGFLSAVTQLELATSVLVAVPTDAAPAVAAITQAIPVRISTRVSTSELTTGS